MFKILSTLAGLMALAMILFGTWPILLGKPPVKPIVNPSEVERLKDAIADRVKDFSLD